MHSMDVCFTVLDIIGSLCVLIYRKGIFHKLQFWLKLRTKGAFSGTTSVLDSLWVSL